MKGKILVSTAYLPPIEYFSIISRSGNILIEREENYIKQTYRNRCYILSSHGEQILTVPACQGSLHKTLVKDIRIDYSKRWQQVHLRALMAAYNSSPYFEFYFDHFEKIISRNHNYLLDLNMELLESILEILKIESHVFCTTIFETINDSKFDFRYKISPKVTTLLNIKKYTQVFESDNDIITRLSIIDLIFNMGPEAGDYL